eukprot:TRINITY_DN12416_c0_g1_i4.p1 TRINITY_DN12416_c0_g1~~TRINITY_DN12416_c0_g1_i4.p1  ORF type:complete len:276 (+),score=84.61 TRINITY_DN12416_c0_g1_i4:179-1006(+)
MRLDGGQPVLGALGSSPMRPSAALAPLGSSHTRTKGKKPRGQRRAALGTALDVLLNTHVGDTRDRSFEDAAKKFKDLQATFSSAMNPKPLRESNTKELAPLGENPQRKLGKPALPQKAQGKQAVGRQFNVLPGIAAEKHVAPAGERSVCPKTMKEVERVLPADYFELKQMMDLHSELKSQMAANRAKLTEIKEVEGDDAGVLALLREQASHVVSMMKDVLARLESYPEELWALYGTAEAYQGCLAEGNQAAQTELYGQLLHHAQGFLEVRKAACE